MYKQFCESNNNEKGRELGMLWLHWKGACRRLSAVGETDGVEILIGEKNCGFVNTGEKRERKVDLRRD